MILRRPAAFGAAAAAMLALLPARDARTPAPPPTEEVIGAPLGCFREGRFLNLDPALCAQVGGVQRPRGETQEEVPQPRPSLRIEVEALD
ncbi:MAG: hypothetical protein AAF684_00415 [Pseudomonadota bacterium]